MLTMIYCNKRVAVALLLATTLLVAPTHSFLAPGKGNNDHMCHQRTRERHTQMGALPAAAASLIAGSVAGAVGVGVAFPLDTIKTKAQVLATTKQSPQKEAIASNANQLVVNADGSATAGSSSSRRSTRTIHGNSNMLQVSQHIWQTEGLGGFFGGVQTSMAGQAIIKAVVFAANAAILDALQQSHAFGDQTAAQLLFAAASAGFITAFIAAPVDRIKVLMQAGGQNYKGKEDVCVKAVLKTEGWKGLMGRGLACTMVREIPAYSLYFGVYGGLQQWTSVADHLGPLAPPIFGAIAGCACWIPIYPIDVVKTVIQNTRGEEKEKNAIEVIGDLYQNHGPQVFYDGIAPRLLRQAVNHAVTFAIYDGLYNNVLT